MNAESYERAVIFFIRCVGVSILLLPCSLLAVTVKFVLQ